MGERVLHKFACYHFIQNKCRELFKRHQTSKSEENYSNVTGQAKVLIFISNPLQELVAQGAGGEINTLSDVGPDFWSSGECFNHLATSQLFYGKARRKAKAILANL